MAELPGTPAEVALWIADVRIRRARALVQLGRRASAMAEAQAGLLR